MDGFGWWVLEVLERYLGAAQVESLISIGRRVSPLDIFLSSWRIAVIGAIGGTVGANVAITLYLYWTQK